MHKSNVLSPFTAVTTLLHTTTTITSSSFITMPSINFLPVELLRQIFSYLDPTDLRAIMIASSHFNSVGEPALYATLRTIDSWLDPHIATLVRRPGLAHHVRRLSLGYLEPRVPPNIDDDLLTVTAASVGLANIAWPPSNDPDIPNGWTDGIPDRGWGAEEQALLLLHLIPDVRELIIYTDTPVLILFLESTLTTPIEQLPLTRLVSFECAVYTQHSPVSLPALVALMRLPSLRRIAADMTSQQTAIPCMDDLIGQCATTHLTLHFGNTRTSVLARILALPSALEHFAYADDEQYLYDADRTPLRDALGALRPSLRVLELHHVFALYRGADRVGSLADWPALVRVECSMSGLLGPADRATERLVDVLPVGIVEIEIWRVEGRADMGEWGVAEMVEQLEEVLRRRRIAVLVVRRGAMGGRRRKAWVNMTPEEVKRRLEAAAEVGASVGCRLVCH